MDTTTSERVATMMAELDVDQTEFAAIAGASKSVVNQWISGLIKSVGAKYAYEIEKKHGYSAEWIQTGRGVKKLVASTTHAKTTLQERITLAFNDENARREKSGETRLTKTQLWQAAGTSSSACTFWFDGSNGMDLATAMKVAPLLRVNAYWLYDGSTSRDADLPGEAAPAYLARKAAPAPHNPATHKALYDLARELARGDLSPEVQALLTSELEAKAKFVRKQFAKFNKGTQPED